MDPSERGPHAGASADRITGSTNDEAIDIYTALERDLQPDMRIPLDQKFGRVGLDSVYQRSHGHRRHALARQLPSRSDRHQ